MSPEERELLETVGWDLARLERELRPDAADHDLRLVTVILRRLLIDGDLQKAYRVINGPKAQPNILAYKINLPKDIAAKSRLAVAGKGRSLGMELHEITTFVGKTTDSDIKKLQDYLDGAGVMYQLRVNEFNQSTAMIIEGVRIKREEIIKYIANKRAGIHFDMNRKHNERAYRLLDSVHERGDIVAGRKAIYFSLLSIGQAVCQSPDIQAFLRKVRERLL